MVIGWILIPTQNYMGDYDGLTTNFTGKNKRFIGAFEWISFGINPDVKAFSFPEVDLRASSI
jgi:hypothetical protein